VLDAAYEQGCTHWDTADVYGDSEELIGKWYALFKLDAVVTIMEAMLGLREREKEMRYFLQPSSRPLPLVMVTGFVVTQNM
jgi:aryl-alcohol dehydrogenase-like predicted oxidoreductase